MTAIVNLAVPRDRLTFAIDHGPSHWRPIMVAVRDAGVSLCVVPQGSDAFAPPADHPAIVLIGDDMYTSQGPRAFHQPSLRRFVSTCRSAVIVASEPVVVAYAAAAASAAGLRQTPSSLRRGRSTRRTGRPHSMRSSRRSTSFFARSNQPGASSDAKR